MRVLILAGYFPPLAPLAATRVASLARFLLARGHDVRVVAARNAGFAATLAPGLPPGTVFFERKPDVDALARAVARPLRALRAAARTRAAATAAASHPAVSLYDACVRIPDGHVAWLPWAIARGSRVVREWRPDVIYASGPPPSGLVAAAWIARRGGTPWIAELRDPWSENEYHDLPAWRRRLDRAIERRVLGSATALVTVTRGWARRLREAYDLPVALVMNGYDAAAYAERGRGDTAHPDRLTIRYTGVLYPGRRDPEPLFAALARAGATAGRFRVQFYGDSLDAVPALAQRHGVGHVVEVYAPLPQPAIPTLQRTADVLLLLGWPDERDRSVIPGKLFEYVGAGRPILHLGVETGEAAELVRARGAGVVANDVDAIARQLCTWQRCKAERGTLPGPDRLAAQGLSREEQFLELEAFVLSTLAVSRRGARRRAAPQPTPPPSTPPLRRGHDARR